MTTRLRTLAALLCLSRALAAAADAPAPGCALDDRPRETLQQFVDAFERSDMAALAAKLDPAMLGWGAFLDGAALDADRSKLVRIRLFDLAWQCGPDLVVVQASWEKRFLDAVAYRPQLDSGRMSVLLFRATEQWRIAAVAGTHPFGPSGGSAAEIAFGPTVVLGTLGTAPTAVPLRLAVTDPDLGRRGSVTVVIRTGSGDREAFTLNAVAPGRFERASLPFAAGAAQPGNGVLEVAGGGTALTLEYVDEQPGQARPATVLRRVAQAVAAAGNPPAPPPPPGPPPVTPPATGTDTDPDPFVIAAPLPAPPEAIVRSAPVIVSGINAPVPVSTIGAEYSVNGAPFTVAPGTVVAGDRIVLQLQKDGAPVNTATLRIGGRSAVWSVPLLDEFTDPFAFAPVVQPPATVVTSNPVTLTGFNAELAIDVSGGSYSINGGPFTTALGFVRAGSVLRLRTTSSPLPGGVVEVFVNLSPQTARWSVTTQSGGGTDTTPDPFVIPVGVATPVLGVTPPGCNYPDAAPVTPIGFNATATLTAAAAQPFRTVQVSVAGGPFVVPPVAIGPGQPFVLRIQPSDNSRLAPSPTPQVVGTVTIGGTSASYAIRCN